MLNFQVAVNAASGNFTGTLLDIQYSKGYTYAIIKRTDSERAEVVQIGHRTDTVTIIEAFGAYPRRATVTKKKKIPGTAHPVEWETLERIQGPILAMFLDPDYSPPFPVFVVADAKTGTLYERWEHDELNAHTHVDIELVPHPACTKDRTWKAQPPTFVGEGPPENSVDHLLYLLAMEMWPTDDTGRLQENDARMDLEYLRNAINTALGL